MFFQTSVVVNDVELFVTGTYSPPEAPSEFCPGDDESCYIDFISTEEDGGTDLSPLFQNATIDINYGHGIVTSDYMSHVEYLVLDKIGKELQESEDEARIDAWELHLLEQDVYYCKSF